MVNLSTILLSAGKHGTGKGHQQWIESLRVYCKAGRGGNGLPTVGGVGKNCKLKIPDTQSYHQTNP